MLASTNSVRGWSQTSSQRSSGLWVAWSILAGFCLLDLAGIVASLFLFRGARWARWVIALIAVVVILGCVAYVATQKSTSAWAHFFPVFFRSFHCRFCFCRGVSLPPDMTHRQSSHEFLTFICFLTVRMAEHRSRGLSRGWLSPATPFLRSRSKVSLSRLASRRLPSAAGFTPGTIFAFLFLTPRFNFTARPLCLLIWPGVSSNCSLPSWAILLLSCGGGSAHQKTGTMMTSP